MDLESFIFVPQGSTQRLICPSRVAHRVYLFMTVQSGNGRDIHQQRRARKPHIVPSRDFVHVVMVLACVSGRTMERR